MTSPSAPSPAQLPQSTVSAGLLVAQRAVAATLAVLVLLMAVMAGRSLFGSWDITVHGIVGNVVFTLAVAAAVLAFVNRSARSVQVVALAFFVLAFAQVGLGYTGRESAEAAAWHVPNGVLLMALATSHLHQLMGRPR